jgi:cellulose synthase/poly-beta-1,6-N-acetylglucosamine synthase-like glycosyltransferase
MIVILLVAAGLLAYTYIGYPLLLALAAQLRPRGHATAAIRPRVSVVIPARDEARALPNKLASLLAQDYPQDRLEILVISDGSTDETARAAASISPRVQVIELLQPLGKPAALNVGAERARGEILVLTDARQPLAPGALAALVEPFCDASVGAVTGALALADGGALSLYRRYDDWIRRQQGACNSTVVVTGALWALRRRHFTPVPLDSLADDLFLPLMVIAQGRRVVCAPGARAFDQLPSDPRADFHRRVRTLAGAFQVLLHAPWLLLPWRNRAFLAFASHKLLRLASPALLVLLFVASTQGPGRLPAGLLAAQVLLYGLALAGCFAENVRGLVAKIARAALAFVMVNIAVVVALFHLVRGSAGTLWRPLPEASVRGRAATPWQARPIG